MIQKFEFQELDLKGAWLIKPFYATDHRGGLIKDYNVDVFREHGISCAHSRHRGYLWQW